MCQDLGGCGMVFGMEIERMGIHGEGVGSLEGLTVFVDGALPGEAVEVEIVERKKTYARGKIQSLLRKSPHRVDPVCPLFGRCGGCQVMHLAYDEQLEEKRKRVQDALERIGKFEGVKVEACQPSKSPLGYRNKIQLPVLGGKMGLYRKGSHEIIPVEHCFIHSDLGEKIFATLGEAPEGVQTVMIRTAINEGTGLVVFITRERIDLRAPARALMEKCPEVRGVLQNINAGTGNRILGPKTELIVGEDHLLETLCGVTFKVSPHSFFQVNTHQAEALYSHVKRLYNAQGGTLLDAYCGVGTLSLIMADQCQSALGIEIVPEAITDAKANAKRNNITNTRFICGPVEKEILKLKQIDTALLNPPRKGCDRAVLDSLLTLRPKQIIYISCDPATLARDLHILTQGGYHLTQVTPFDMFPQTAHVETVASLSY